MKINSINLWTTKRSIHAHISLFLLYVCVCVSILDLCLRQDRTGNSSSSSHVGAKQLIRRRRSGERESTCRRCPSSSSSSLQFPLTWVASSSSSSLSASVHVTVTQFLSPFSILPTGLDDRRQRLRNSVHKPKRIFGRWVDDRHQRHSIEPQQHIIGLTLMTSSFNIYRMFQTISFVK